MRSIHTLTPITFLIIFLLPCTGLRAQVFKDGEKEIVAIESAFQQMTETRGIAHAFRYYAAPDAVLNRNNQLIEGREAIYNFYNTSAYQKARVNWTPKEVKISASGDLAFSYGTYTWVSVKDDGTEQESEGIYMTIWQKQPDGAWKYVWD